MQRSLGAATTGSRAVVEWLVADGGGVGGTTTGWAHRDLLGFHFAALEKKK